ncbi:hypothetical protein BgiMline_007385 [Biomphalaria glabrata]|nr:hypothetical protein BgiMline_022954 [Biomphalaria glabrata]
MSKPRTSDLTPPPSRNTQVDIGLAFYNTIWPTSAMLPVRVKPTFVCMLTSTFDSGLQYHYWLTKKTTATLYLGHQLGLGVDIFSSPSVSRPFLFYRFVP